MKKKKFESTKHIYIHTYTIGINHAAINFSIQKSEDLPNTKSGYDNFLNTYKKDRVGEKFDWLDLAEPRLLGLRHYAKNARDVNSHDDSLQRSVLDYILLKDICVRFVVWAKTTCI